MLRRNAKQRVLSVSAVFVTLLLVCPVNAEAQLEFPGPELGKAEGRTRQGELVLENNVVACTWVVTNGRIRLTSITDKLSGSTLQIGKAECFYLVLARGQNVKSSDLSVTGDPELSDLEPKPKACRLAERYGGKQITATLVSSGGDLKVKWCAILRDGSNYIRQDLQFSMSREAAEVEEIVLFEFPLPGARVVGTVDGSLAAAGTMFFAVEHPMSRTEVIRGQLPQVRCSLPHRWVLRPGQLIALSDVMGVVPQGQLRRAFLYYVERERAQPYRSFLHYNSWYDIGYGGEKIQQSQCIEVIELFGKELVTRRKVVMDSFALDDGWDDAASLWQFHKGFPNGFSPLREVAEKCDSALGAWLSPFGGYGEAKKQRIKYGLQQSFETNQSSFSLAGPRYYARFRDVCVKMIREYGLNYFKFDGIGAGDRPTGAGDEFAQDVEALLRLVSELRQAKPDVFVNITTGTWPSPYWLWYGDSTWRSGSDWSTHGWGSKRQQQITYRDKETYHNVVCRAPLYPLTSLMTQGVMFANHGLPNEAEGLVDDIQAFFASGTNCQELYITPSLMNPQHWDALAEAARWSRDNVDVLVDTHWVGGDPAEGQVYGWASWSRRKGILSLRNPNDNPGKITVDICKVFELPKGAAQKYSLRIPWKKNVKEAEIVLPAGQEHTFELKPFEVLVFDAKPL